MGASLSKSRPRETQVYPSVSSTVFQGIACVQLDEDEWWLVADMQTACTPEGNSPMLTECLVASLLIPIGMPIMVALQLYTQRRELQTPGIVNTKRRGGWVEGGRGLRVCYYSPPQGQLYSVRQH